MKNNLDKLYNKLNFIESRLDIIESKINTIVKLYDINRNNSIPINNMKGSNAFKPPLLEKDGKLYREI